MKTLLDATFFTHNREMAVEKLQGGLLVVSGYTGMQKTNDEEFRFMQEANMWYLTGIEFPDWWLIVDGKLNKSWLVEPTIDERNRLFMESLDTEDARQKSGISTVISRDEAMRMLRNAAKTRPLVYTVGHSPYVDYFSFALNPAIGDMRLMLERTFVNVRDFRSELAKIRMIKQPIEIEQIQKSIDLTVKGMEIVKEKLQTYKNEYQIEAELSYAFQMSGGGQGFEPIVASGKNATVAHYFQNNTPLKKGSFIMMDVGAAVGRYSADITRTYAFGKPTKRMQLIHEAVERAQREIVSLIKPGLSFNEYYAKSDKIIKNEMIQLGIITSLDDDNGYRRHMPHALGHGLGVDLHDTPGMSGVFQPNMIVTVEPGIYLKDEGIGVRIEDDILVTQNGYKNMSAKLSTAL